MKQLRIGTEGIEILDPEKETKIKQALKSRKKEEKNLTDKFIDIESSIDWLNTINDINKEIAHLCDEESKLKTDIRAFKPDREKLDRALSAASLDGAYEKLIACRKQQADDREELKIVEESLPKLESDTKKQAKLMEEMEQKITLKKEELKSAVPILKKVRSLDQTLSNLKKRQQMKMKHAKMICQKFRVSTKSVLRNRKNELKFIRSWRLLTDTSKRMPRMNG